MLFDVFLVLADEVVVASEDVLAHVSDNPFTHAAMSVKGYRIEVALFASTQQRTVSAVGC